MPRHLTGAAMSLSLRNVLRTSSFIHRSESSAIKNEAGMKNGGTKAGER